MADTKQQKQQPKVKVVETETEEEKVSFWTKAMSWKQTAQVNISKGLSNFGGFSQRQIKRLPKSLQLLLWIAAAVVLYFVWYYLLVVLTMFNILVALLYLILTIWIFMLAYQKFFAPKRILVVEVK